MKAGLELAVVMAVTIGIIVGGLVLADHFIPQAVPVHATVK